MEINNFTVCFRVKDHGKFMEFLDQLSPHFASDKASFHGADITGMGWEDSMTALDMIRAFCEQEDIDLPEHLQ